MSFENRPKLFIFPLISSHHGHGRMALLLPLLHQKTHPEILIVGGLRISFLVFGGSFHVMLLTNVEKIHVQIRENKNNHIASNSYREVQQWNAAHYQGIHVSPARPSFCVSIVPVPQVNTVSDRCKHRRELLQTACPRTHTWTSSVSHMQSPNQHSPPSQTGCLPHRRTEKPGEGVNGI